MKLAICNEVFEGWRFADACAAVRDAGYSGIEIAPFTFGKPVQEISPTECAAWRAEARCAGLEIVGLHWLLAKTHGFHINSPDAAVRQRTVAHLVDLVELCAELGGGVMVFGSPQQRHVSDGVSLEQATDYAIETLRALVPALESRGVTFCLEPLAKCETDFINTAGAAADIINAVGSPNVQLILDVKAMSLQDEPIPDTIRGNKSILKHFHANDANLRGPGFGNTDFVPIARALKEIGYSGWVSVEVFDFTPDPVTIANKSIQYLKSVFD